MVWGERDSLLMRSAYARARTFQSNMFAQMYDTPGNKLIINNLSQTRSFGEETQTLYNH